MRRVVVTGMGVIAPNGIGLQEFEKSLREGKSGCAPITAFDTTKYPFEQAYEIKGFNAKDYGMQGLDPFIQYAVAASEEAVNDSGLRMDTVDPFRIGISVSSSKGGVHTLERFSERFRKRPSALLGARLYVNSVPNFAAQWLARRWQVRGPALCYVAACATGTVAVGEGVRRVRDGVVDYCLAGASDASIVPLMLSGYRKMKVLSRDRMRPFDKERSGFLVGEGAGILMLETLESAQKRDAHIYAELTDATYGSNSCDTIHFKEEENALSEVLTKFLEKNSWKAGDIDYVNLHGTGTMSGDIYEARQIRKAFGKAADKIAMSATKSMTGHMLGASGAVEMIASLLAMNGDFIPPTAGLENPDPKCEIDLTPLKSVNRKVSCAVSHSMGFGGHVAVIGMRRVEI